MISIDVSERFRQLKCSQLARLLNVEPGAVDPWGAADLAAMFRHQLAAPVDFDLSSLPAEEANPETVAMALEQSASGQVGTFAALLTHPQPPVDLLRLSKDFFKHRAAQFPKGSPDWQLAYCFYLLTILVGHQHRIPLSTLTPAELRQAADWALQQSWVDNSARALIERVRAQLAGPGHAA
jgi:hypothetical protein